VHRPDIAAAVLDAVPGLAVSPPGRVLAADVAQARGEYAAARAGYRQAAREDPLWDTTARLAALAQATGADDEADVLYAAAEDDITAKQMRAFAWVRVQRAELARSLGDLDRAARLLADADRAYPCWWYVTAHIAALDLAAGRPDRAVTGYRGVLAAVDRPDFHEALGVALQATGDADAAAASRAAALTAYLASVARGEVHYLHHLAAFHVDVHPPAAVSWAREDAELRRNGTTLSLLACCLYRAGRRDDALAVLDEAFALGAGDALLRSRAHEIRKGAT
jgi:tetratricopeptide (TPR) repeat protein